jgi:hypothetical protein
MTVDNDNGVPTHNPRLKTDDESARLQARFSAAA